MLIIPEAMENGVTFEEPDLSGDGYARLWTKGGVTTLCYKLKPVTQHSSIDIRIDIHSFGIACQPIVTV
uniref:Uncharacterized protein n=1 Tax=Hyaloperonospora arabidopsidis (strain Emoy2) TaxID=559515 RepID=M4BSL6_HYAAE